MANDIILLFHTVTEPIELAGGCDMLLYVAPYDPSKAWTKLEFIEDGTVIMIRNIKQRVMNQYFVRLYNLTDSQDKKDMYLSTLTGEPIPEHLRGTV